MNDAITPSAWILTDEDGRQYLSATPTSEELPYAASSPLYPGEPARQLIFDDKETSAYMAEMRQIIVELIHEIHDLKRSHDHRTKELIEANNRNIELRRTYRRLIREAFDAGVSTSIAWQRTPVSKRTTPLNEVAEQKFADFAELKIPSPHTHNQGSN